MAVRLTAFAADGALAPGLEVTSFDAVQPLCVSLCGTQPMRALCVGMHSLGKQHDDGSNMQAHGDLLWRIIARANDLGIFEGLRASGSRHTPLGAGDQPVTFKADQLRSSWVFSIPSRSEGLRRSHTRPGISLI